MRGGAIGQIWYGQLEQHAFEEGLCQNPPYLRDTRRFSNRSLTMHRNLAREILNFDPLTSRSLFLRKKTI